MSKKYVIEIKPEYEDTIKGVMVLGAMESNLYVDTLSIEDLEELNSDYINEHFGELQDEAYQRGYEEGRKVGIKDGMCEAWEAARKLAVETDDGGISISALYEMFGTESMCMIMKNNTVYDAIDKLKAYEEKKDDSIKVGDEVIYNGTTRCLVVTPETGDRYASLLDCNGIHYSADHRECKKTGRHFDIQSILEAMKNG